MVFNTVPHGCLGREPRTAVAEFSDKQCQKLLNFRDDTVTIMSMRGCNLLITCHCYSVTPSSLFCNIFTHILLSVSDNISNLIFI